MQVQPGQTVINKLNGKACRVLAAVPKVHALYEVEYIDNGQGKDQIFDTAMVTAYGYIGFYNGKKVELYAPSLYEAKMKAVKFFKPPRSKEHMVSVVLAEKGGKGVVHTPDM